MMTPIDPDLPSCEKCGKPFEPRSGSGGSLQRFCCTDCRLSFHRERLRCQRAGLYAGRSTRAATPHATTHAEPHGLETGFVLMRQQDVVEVTWDQRGNLLLWQGRGLGGDHELYICRDYFPRFLETVDELRELPVDAIRKDRAR
jgi:hypothetical protein